jgi:transposase
MRQHSNSAKDPAEKVVKDIRRATRKQYSAEEKIRIVDGEHPNICLPAEETTLRFCRRPRHTI